MPCYCSELRKLRSDLNNLDSAKKSVESAYELFSSAYTQQKEDLIGFFQTSNPYLFRVNALDRMTMQIENYEEDLPKSLNNLIYAISTDRSDLSAKISRYESSDKSYHSKKKKLASSN